MTVRMILYRAGWRAALALARPLSHLDGKTGRSLRGRLNGAAALEAWARAERRPAAPLVWFHAASVGEGRQGEVVLRRLRERHPDWQLIFTYSSSSAERFASSLPVDFAGYLPVDTRAEVSRALDAARPAALVFSATDIWPELTAAAASRAVRLALVSAALAPTSSGRSAPARWLLRPAYAALDVVGAIDSAAAAGLIELGARERAVCITGDTRHDAAEARARTIDPSAPHLRALAGPGRPPVVVAGSTWPADEEVLIPAWATVRADGPASRLIIAPHEPTERHLQRTEQQCRKALHSAAIVRLSALEAAPTAAPDWDVC
ncbi:MAG TPA: glycosyltransferase N-terminal domain-containing protein, partial [Gemmatimonadales bacterium]|nr:glycosyltransferase N-terminal domain-containing protein [Gemmatimonadales bacterium]